jgi:Domain of unknown function (DUF4440)
MQNVERNPLLRNSFEFWCCMKLSKGTARSVALPFALAAVIVTLIHASPAFADSTSFVSLEARLSDALADFRVADVGELWDDSFVFVFPSGELRNKADRLAALKRPADTGGPRLVSHNDSVTVQYEDANVAVVIVRSSWRFGDKPPDPYIATHVWIKRVQGWRLLSAQVAQLKVKP